jgi:hypothetical protein
LHCPSKHFDRSAHLRQHRLVRIEKLELKQQQMQNVKEGILTLDDLRKNDLEKETLEFENKRDVL